MNLARFASDKIRNLVWTTSLGASHFIHRQKHIYSNVDSVIATYETNMGVKKDRFKRYKLLSLQRFLEEHRPMSILEFGTGASTTILSNYADKYGAKIVAVETNEWWANFVRQNVGNNVEVRLCSSSGDAGSTPKALRFNIDLGDERFDMAIIDGPGETFEGIGKKEGVTMNVLEMVHLPNIVMIDGRKATVNYMKTHPLMANYDFIASDIQAKTVIFPEYQYFSVFQKKTTTTKNG